ncbi:MAG: hypothetical protein ACE5EO_06930 [Candidatus Krumholzibacteriia bacterium]
MPHRARTLSTKHLVLCLGLAAAFIVLTSCSSAPRKTQRTGIKLSEASKEAEKKPEDQKPLRKKKEKGEKDDPIVIDRDDDDDTGIGIGLGFADSGSDDDDLRSGGEKERVHVGVIVGGGSLGSDELDGFGLFGIQVGPDFFNERVRVDIRGLVMPTNQSEQATLGSGLDNEIEFAGDVGGRFYLTPRHTFMGLYTHLGLRVGHLSWDYKNPIQFVGTGGLTETIGDDGVAFFAVFGGVGVGLAQFRAVHLGANLSFGYKSYSSTTSKGFENNVFSDEPFTQLMLEFTGFVDWF